MDRIVLIVAAFAIIGIGMIIAGIFNLRSSATEEEVEIPTKKRSKKNRAKKSEAKSDSNLLANWMFGGHRGMDLKKQGRMRIQIGIVLIVIALIIAGTYLL